MRCAPRTDLTPLIADICHDCLKLHTSTSFFPHFWRANSKKSQYLPWDECCMPGKADGAARCSEFSWMQGARTESWNSIGFGTLLLSF